LGVGEWGGIEGGRFKIRKAGSVLLKSKLFKCWKPLLPARSGPAQVLYVASSRASWKDYEYDIARDYEDLGEYLCLGCSWARLRPVLLSNPREFAECGGLWLPHEGAGIFIGTE
jgi:hypothetical protein